VNGLCIETPRSETLIMAAMALLGSLEAGVRLVWVIFSEQRLIHVHKAPDHNRVVTEPATLDGGTVLPGFQLPLDRLFDRVVRAGAGE
jgi:hypothetical protein